MEENNLFLIKTNQEEEIILEKAKKKSNNKIKQAKKDIEVMEQNHLRVVFGKDQQVQKSKALSSTMRNTADCEEGRKKAKEKVEKLKLLRTLINEIFHRLGIKIENSHFSSLNMLSQLEQKLDLLIEARDFINTKKRKELSEKEKKVEAARKLTNHRKKKMKEVMMMQDKALKNIEKMKKQENVKIFNGHKQQFRSTKDAREKEEDSREEMDEEVMDYIRYVGSTPHNKDHRRIASNNSALVLTASN